jgi:hypothetical protein
MAFFFIPQEMYSTVAYISKNLLGVTDNTTFQNTSPSVDLVPPTSEVHTATVLVVLKT